MGDQLPKANSSIIENMFQNQQPAIHPPAEGSDTCHDMIGSEIILLDPKDLIVW